MRILVLASYIPSRFKGAEIRLLYLLRYLSQHHEITLWAINRRGVPEAEVAALLPNCELALQDWPTRHRGRVAGRIGRSSWFRWLQTRQTWLGPKPSAINKIYHPALKAQLDQWLADRHFDLIHVNQIMVWQYLSQPFTTPVILCKDNVWSDLAQRDWQTAAGKLDRYLKERDALKMRHYESLAVASADQCVVVSKQDEALTRQLVKDVPVTVIPNGVDTDYFRPSSEAANQLSLVFTGAMGWQPNADAMIFFCQEILPLLRRDFPEVKLSIVGLYPPAEVVALSQDPNIDVTGFVPDVRPYIAGASVYIVPLRSGSGTRLKILEAMAMGKAVVSTRIGAEGLAVENGRHLILADEPHEFAAAVRDLLRDPARQQALGQAGRQLVENSYDWKAIAADLDRVYQQTVRPI